MEGSCSSCGDKIISELHNRLRDVKHGGVPLPLPRSGVLLGTRGDAAYSKKNKTKKGRGDFRITVRAFPSGVSHISNTPQPVRVPLDRAGTSAEWGTPPVSFGTPPGSQWYPKHQ